MPTSKIPEFTQFDSGKSIMRYLPAKGTAGLARFVDEPRGIWRYTCRGGWKNFSTVFTQIKDHKKYADRLKKKGYESAEQLASAVSAPTLVGEDATKFEDIFGLGFSNLTPQARLGRITDDLNDAKTVAQVNEHQAAVIAVGMHPPGQFHLFAYIALEELPARMRAITCFDSFHGCCPCNGEQQSVARG